jgi:peptidoglycan/LPS O-acetylase OafA/YrhL
MEPVAPPSRLEQLPSTPFAPSRLGWLDALRGIAALVVVFEHSSYSFMAELRRELTPEFNIGRYGVMVFFLVSGYIIPASLERRGCIRTFWIGRIFRIYPLWLVVVTAILAANLLDLAKLRGDGEQSAAGVAAAHVTLLQELLGTPSLLIVLWTLSYETAFYLLVVALFTTRQHKRSAAVAVTLAVSAAATAGVTLPVSALSNTIGTGPLITLASITMVTAICCASSGSPALRVFGGVAGGALALTLAPFNGTVPMWEGLVILAVMFLGTAIYRAETGQTTWRSAACAAFVVIACAVGSASWHTSHFSTPTGWITAFLAAILTFGAGLTLRHQRIPRWLIGLGTISYSVYLIHPVLLAISDGTTGRSKQDNPILEVTFYAALLPLCLLTYRYIEAPSQKWGRKLARHASTH